MNRLERMPAPVNGLQVGAELLFASGHGESALGGEFLSFFRYETHRVGHGLQGDGAHFLGGGHFQVKAGSLGPADELHVPVLDMASVFAQMDDDGVGSGQFGQMGCGDGLGFDAHAGLAKGGHVIDIDGEDRHG